MTTTIYFLEHLQFCIHYGLHFILPGILAWYFYNPQWKKVWIIWASTILVDLDHLLATPMFDPTRCSIGFHPLHSYPAIAIYIILLFPARTRLVAIGLVMHMLTDYQDCCWNRYIMALQSQLI